MTGELPVSICVGGIDYPINTDFRDILDILRALSDGTLSNAAKKLVMLEILFKESLPPDLDEAAEKAALFIDAGRRGDNSGERTIDYETDEQLLFSAVNRAAGYEIRNPARYLHWWTFLGYCAEISPESPLAQIVSLREKRLHGEQLSPAELRFYNKNRRLIDLPDEKRGGILEFLRGD